MKNLLLVVVIQSNSYRSRNYEGIGSKPNPKNKIPNFSHSSINYESKHGHRKGVKSNLNSFNPKWSSVKSDQIRIPESIIKHSRLKSHFGVVPVFVHHHGDKNSSKPFQYKNNL